MVFQVSKGTQRDTPMSKIIGYYTKMCFHGAEMLAQLTV